MDPQDTAGTRKGGRELRKALVMMLLLSMVFALAVSAGCGDKETVETPLGEVKVEEDGGTVTYKTEGGDVSYNYSEKVPSEKELGAPIYPGAELVPGSGAVVSGSGPEGEFTTAGAEFITTHGFDKVVDFYNGKMGDPLIVEETAREATWMKEMDDGSIVTVTVSDEDGEVHIQIGRIGGVL